MTAAAATPTSFGQFMAFVATGSFAALTNLGDRRYASSVVVNAAGARYFEPGPRRSVQMGLSAGWR